MNIRTVIITVIAGIGLVSAVVAFAAPPSKTAVDAEIARHAQTMMEEGKKIFRYDTFGSEAFWGDRWGCTRQSPAKRTAASAPASLRRPRWRSASRSTPTRCRPRLSKQIKAGKVNLDDPATTIALLKLNAVVGVTAFATPDGGVKSMGIQCALCHSTVDDSFAPGIGKRLDGWANRDLNVGAIVSLAPNLKPFTDLLGVDVADREEGAGQLGARPLRRRPRQGRQGVPARRQAGGRADSAGVWPGRREPAHLDRLGLSAVLERLRRRHGDARRRYVLRRAPGRQDPVPVSAKSGAHHMEMTPDRTTDKLAALHFYQLAIPAPKPPAGSFNAAAAEKGKALFMGKAGCARCHVPPLYTEPGNNIHAPSEVGVDSFQADRSPTKSYRTAPLAGLWSHQKGGFYHDGRFATLADVVNHYNTFLKLNLSDEKRRTNWWNTSRGFEHSGPTETPSSTDLPTIGILENRDRRAVATYKRELIRHRRTESGLRQALARDEALLYQQDELIQQQTVLSQEFRSSPAERPANDREPAVAARQSIEK